MNNTNDTVSILKQLEAWAKKRPGWPEQERKLREFERQLKAERYVTPEQLFRRMGTLNSR